MSTLLSQKSRDAICGYCRTFKAFVPSEIIDICIAFCNVGEEFDSQLSTFPIEGANHTICRISNDQTGVLFGFGRNVIAANNFTFYHWKLRVSADSSYKYTIGIVDQESCSMIMEYDLSFGCGSNLDQKSTVTYDLYVNFETSQVWLYPKGRKWSRSHSIDSDRKYRMSIQSSSSTALFEILSFDVAQANDTPLKLALAMNGSRDEKISLFESAIRTNLKSFTYCDEYIWYLMIQKQYDKAYEFILKHNQSKNIPIFHIADIAYLFYEKMMLEKSRKMFDLIDDETLMEDMDLVIAKGDVCTELGDGENALKYFDLCLENTENKAAISFCLSKKADLMCKMGEVDIDESILLMKRALEYEPNSVTQLNNLGCFCLTKGNYSEARKYLKRAIALQPNGKYVNGNMANLLYAMKRYDESIPFFEKSLQICDDLKHPEVGPKCLENYANILYIRQKYKKSNDLLYQLIQRNDFAQHKNKDVVYFLMSLNFEKMGNLKKAMQYVKKAHRIQPKKVYETKMKKLKYKRTKA